MSVYITLQSGTVLYVIIPFKMEEKKVRSAGNFSFAISFASFDIAPPLVALSR